MDYPELGTNGLIDRLLSTSCLVTLLTTIDDIL